MILGSTHFLRLAIVLFGLAVLAFCIAVIPSIYANWADIFPEYAYATYPIVIGLLLTAVAFYAALYQGMLLLRYIDKNKAFSEQTVAALQKIKYCGIVISAIYVLGMPAIYLVAETDDAPGLIVIGMAFAGAPLVVAVFAALMQKLVQSAIEIKHENELTV